MLSGLLPLLEAHPLFQATLARLRDGAGTPVSLGPVLEAAKPALLAALAEALSRTLLVVAPRADLAERLREQVQRYAPAPDRVWLWPAGDPLPYERLPVDPEVGSQRLAVLQALAAGEPVVVVASVRALMQPTLPVEEWRANASLLHPGQRVALEQLLAGWVRLGYRRQPLVEEPGTFAQRGGIVDVFPTAGTAPVRIDLFGDEIESLRTFDPRTQRSTGTLDRLAVTPGFEVPLWRAGPAVDALRHLPADNCRPEVAEEWLGAIERLGQGEAIDGLEVFAPYFSPALTSLVEYLPADIMVVLDDPEQVRLSARELAGQAEELRGQLERQGELPTGLRRPYLLWPEVETAIGGRPVATIDYGVTADGAEGEETLGDSTLWEPAPGFGGRLPRLVEELRAATRAGQAVVVVSQQSQRLREVCTDHDLLPTQRKGPRGEGLGAPPAPGSLHLVQGSVVEGWRSPELNLILLTDAEIFGWTRPRRRSPRRRRMALEAFLQDLSPGDYVVHVEHGVGRYHGLTRMGTDGAEREYLQLEYAAGDRLYVPVDQLDRVAPYLGVGGQEPSLHRLGTAEWGRVKRKVRQAVQALARELLGLYSVREVVGGHPFSPDTPWQLEMEEAFPYTETEDQLRAIQEVKADMERARPMDRLICGDVGYGKTEVALRAAFKAVADGKQVAVLVPTTVLAQQHFSNFTERMTPFPVRVEMLSRFRGRKEQEQITAGLRAGSVDVVVGTHRLLQPDVAFKDLGLVVVDEEQRFGVRAKERLKRLRQEVDVLTLTATPIPRTLHMALSGVRDMSVIETPPEDRLPVRTFVTAYSDRLVREAVLRELDRGGQVYYLHNRVHSIAHSAQRLHELVPDARIAVGHGQMDEHQLEKIMLDFVEGRYDVLVCTTIIESGLDIANVNTLIVEDAVGLGLAQLYQLRGRVGRGHHRAYAYFLYPAERPLQPAARERLHTIQQATELGSGFRIALKDLEMRGAGNLLGPEQHGHVAAVGFDLYCRLLAQAVEELRGGKPREVDQAPVSLDLPLEAYLPPDYVDDESLRLRLYQRLAAPLSDPEITELSRELADRFGPLPDPARNLVALLRTKAQALRGEVEAVSTVEGDLVVRLRHPVGLRTRFPEHLRPHLRVTPHQVRLRRGELGEDWLSQLKEVLEALEEDAGTAVGAGASPVGQARRG